MDRFKILAMWAAFAGIAGLAACGSEDAADGAASRAGPAPSAPRGDASAAEVAKESRGKVKCPARAVTATRAADAPVDDILGVRPGMTYEEAENMVLCSDALLVARSDNSRGFRIQAYGQALRQGFEARFAQDRVEKSPREILAEMQNAAIARGMNAAASGRVRPGEASWYVGTMGLPGEERAIIVERQEWFAEGRNPTVASVADAFVQKYGTAAYVHDAAAYRVMGWAYDPRGRPLTETSPFYDCARSGPDVALSLQPDCGVVVVANISTLGDNREIATGIHVRSVDHSAAYERITATEAALEQAEMQRRADQTRQASEHADAPRL